MADRYTEGQRFNDQIQIKAKGDILRQRQEEEEAEAKRLAAEHLKNTGSYEGLFPKVSKPMGEKSQQTAESVKKSFSTDDGSWLEMLKNKFKR